MKLSSIAAALAAAVLTAASADAATYELRDAKVTVVCPLTVGGSFEGKTTALSGEVAISGDSLEALDGTLTVDLTTLDSGIELRNTHMREKYLEVQKGDGYKDAKLTAIKLDPAKLDAEVAFRADFTVHGQTKEVKGSCKISKSGDAYTVEASFPVKVLDHQIAKPSYLGVGVKDEVKVKVAFTAVAKSEGSK